MAIQCKHWFCSCTCAYSPESTVQNWMYTSPKIFRDYSIIWQMLKDLRWYKLHCEMWFWFSLLQIVLKLLPAWKKALAVIFLNQTLQKHAIRESRSRRNSFHGSLELAQTDFCIAVYIWPKKCWSLSFCVDYKNLNAVTAKEAYPVLQMEEILDLFGEVGIFSTLDDNSEYGQIEIDDQDKDKQRLDRTKDYK